MLQAFIYANLSVSFSFLYKFRKFILKHSNDSIWASWRPVSPMQFNIIQFECCLVCFLHLEIEYYVFLSELLLLNANRTIEIGADRFKIPDILFNPSLIQVHGSQILTIPLQCSVHCIFCNSAIFSLFTL